MIAGVAFGFQSGRLKNGFAGANSYARLTCKVYRLGKPAKGNPMSMMKTLAKVAAAVALAKGARPAMKQDHGDARGLFAALNSTHAGDMAAMSRVLAGNAVDNAGLGALLEALATDAKAVGDAPSDLDNLIGGLSDPRAAASAEGASFGVVLRSYLDPDHSPLQPTADQEAAAALMVRALLQAARHLAVFDDGQRATLFEALDGVSDGAHAFVAAELDKPVDVAGFAGHIPPWLEAQVYAVSVLGVDLRHDTEASYLRDLAGKMAVSNDSVNMIHDSLGLPRLYQ